MLENSGSVEKLLHASMLLVSIEFEQYLSHLGGYFFIPQVADTPFVGMVEPFGVVKSKGTFFQCCSPLAGRLRGRESPD